MKEILLFFNGTVSDDNGLRLENDDFEAPQPTKNKQDIPKKRIDFIEFMILNLG